MDRERSQEQRESWSSVEARDAWVDASIKANETIPQTVFGIGLYVAEASMADTDFSLKKLEQSQLTDEQVDRMREAMNSMHKSHGVKLGERDRSLAKDVSVHDATRVLADANRKENMKNKLRALWSGIVSDASDILKQTAVTFGCDLKSMDESQKSLMVEFFETVKSALESDEGEHLTSLWREAVVGRRDDRDRISIEIRDLVLKNVKNKFPDLSEERLEALIPKF